MTKAIVYNLQGEKSGYLELPPQIFSEPKNQALIKQVFLAQTSNARQVSANTKTRAQVSGGGRKPWRQKGTGRARHGSIRSPIWRGGGVTFGPNNKRNFSKKLNKHMRQKALRSVLASKMQDQEIKIINDFSWGAKTGPAAKVISLLFPSQKSVLVVLPAETKIEIKRSLRNLAKVHFCAAASLSVKDLLNHQFVLLSKQAVGQLLAGKPV